MLCRIGARCEQIPNLGHPPLWSLAWNDTAGLGYDRYGNRQQQVLVAGSAPAPCLAISTTTNQITGTCSLPGGFSYDANGNMTNDGLNSLAYDAENHTVTANTSNTYSYDGNGLRVQKVSSSATTTYIFSGSKPIAEYDGSGDLKTEYIYSGDQLLASTWGLSNPGFEEGLTGWHTWGTASVVNNSAQAHSGNDYLQVSTSSAAGAVFNEYIPVTTGQLVNFGGWAYGVSGSASYVDWQLIELDSSYTPVAYITPSPTSPATGSWTYQSGSATIPSGVVYVQLYCQIWGASAPVVANFDDGFISASGTNYYLRDHLSARVTTDASANVIGQQGHFPFGEQWYASSSTTKWQFTSYERDSETGDDYAQARHHINRLGRFSSPDPLAGDIGDPQSLNRYSYVRNTPIDLMDPTGMRPGCNSAYNRRGDTNTQADGNGDGPSDTPADGELEPQGGCSSNRGQECAFTSPGSWGWSSIPCGLVGGSEANDVFVNGQLASGYWQDSQGTGYENGDPYPISESVWVSGFDWEAFFTSGATDGTQAPLSGGDQNRLNNAKQKAILNLINPNCLAFLEAHGIDTTALAGAIAGEVGYNALQSTITEAAAHVYDAQYAPNQAAGAQNEFQTVTVAQAMRSNPGTGAMAETPGNAVYFRPGLGGGINPGSVLHEGLHNLTGMGDIRLAAALGLPTGSGSADINAALAANKCR